MLIQVPEYIGKKVQPHSVKKLDPKILPILKPSLSYDKYDRPTVHEMKRAFEEFRDGRGNDPYGERLILKVLENMKFTHKIFWGKE